MNYDRRQTIDHTHYKKRTTNFFVVRFSIEDSLLRGLFLLKGWQLPILQGVNPPRFFTREEISTLASPQLALGGSGEHSEPKGGSVPCTPSPALPHACARGRAFICPFGRVRPFS